MRIILHDSNNGDLVLETEYAKIVIELDGSYNLRIHMFNYFVNITVENADIAFNAFNNLAQYGVTHITGTFKRLPQALNKL